MIVRKSRRQLGSENLQSSKTNEYHHVTRDVISVFSRGGKVLTEFLGGEQNMKKKYFVGKNTKSHFFQNLMTSRHVTLT